jgi:HD-GYP domain-containing protein (c-di-GMP phosphodiesterase class II)
MKDLFWRPISVDSIIPAYFPKVALYLKSAGNYVLYKDQEREFTEGDQSRLENSFTEFLYVRSGDMGEVNSYLEKNLTEMLAREDLSGMAKGRILYQTSVNCVIEVFESPELAANFDRCRKLIGHMMTYVATEAHALESLQSIVAHNFYIFAHSVQVTALNLLIHEKLFNVTPDEMIDVGIGSLLHDFGMIFISDEILEKPDALSDMEYYRVKQHPQKGYEFLKNTGLFSEVALTIVLHHHERYNGNGYPEGSMGSEIPRSAQLTAICDVYSALTTERPYRKPSTPLEALGLMREEAKAGTFNNELFNRFAEIITTMKGVSNQERVLLLTRPPQKNSTETILRNPGTRCAVSP